MVSIDRVFRAEDAPAALVLPGAGYTVQRPLLHWGAQALAALGFDVWNVDWHDDVDPAARVDPAGFVANALEQAADSMGRRPAFLLAKSLGSWAATAVSGWDLGAVWLTPLLHRDAVLQAINTRAPRDLSVGGGVDPSWLPERLDEAVRSLNIPGADHSLERGLSWSVNLAIVREVMVAVEREGGAAMRTSRPD